MLCHSIYLQVVKVHLFNIRLPMNRFLQKTKKFSLALHLRKCRLRLRVYIVIQSLKDIASVNFFLQRYTRNFQYLDEFSEFKNDEIQKEHTFSLSLLVNLSMHFDFCERMCIYQSLSPRLNLQKRFGSRSDPNGIQERMFRQFKKLCMR